MMLIMLLIFQVKVPEVEIDPAPKEYDKIIQEDPHHNGRIFPEVLVIFRTWIAYIHKVIFSMFIHNPKSYVSSIKFQYHLSINLATPIFKDNKIQVWSSSKEFYLYHDHYMIHHADSKISKFHTEDFVLQDYLFGMLRKIVKFKHNTLHPTLSFYYQGQD